MPPKSKKVSGFINLQIQAGAATPAPPVGPALGQHGVNIMEFVKAYNAATEHQRGSIIPVVITVYEDRTFDFITKTPPASELIKKAAGVQKGAGEPHKVFTRDEILSRLRGHDADVYTRAIDILISRIRRKLEPLDCIKTLRNAGYTFAGARQP